MLKTRYILASCALLSATVLGASFTDMPTDYSTDALNSAVENKLLNGYDGKIMPEDALTRAQMASILVRVFNTPEVADPIAFDDVKTTDWFYEDIAKATEMGIFQGDGNNMNPNAPITRQDAFLVLSRAFQIEGEGDLSQFTDKEEISSYATEALSALVANDLVKGSNGEINPMDNIKRKDFAVMMDRIVDSYINEPQTISDKTYENVMINVSDVTLEDVEITGNLYIGNGALDGKVTFKNVTVNGKTIVSNDDIDNLVIDDESSLNLEGIEQPEEPSSGGGNSGGGSDPDDKPTPPDVPAPDEGGTEI